MSDEKEKFDAMFDEAERVRRETEEHERRYGPSPIVIDAYTVKWRLKRIERATLERDKRETRHRLN